MSKDAGQPAEATSQAGNATTEAATTTEQAKPGTESRETPAATEPAKAAVTETKETKDAASAAKPVVPEKYDLKLPEKSELPASRVETLQAYAKEKGFSNEQAQELLDRESSAVGAFIESTMPGGARWTQQVDQWEAQALADKEIGGSKEALAQSAEFARRALKELFPEPVQKFLEATGYGSHPDVLRGFAKLGRQMAPDKLIQGGASGAGEEASPEQVLYGKTTK